MTIPEEENGEMEYACPVCGAGVSGDAEKCDNCGEIFATANGNGMTNGDEFESEMDEELAVAETGDEYVETGEETVETGEEYDEAETELVEADEDLVEAGEEYEEAEPEFAEVGDDDPEYVEEVTVEETSETEYLPEDEVEEAGPDELETDGLEVENEFAEEEELYDQDGQEVDLKDDVHPLDEHEEKFCLGCDMLLGPDDDVCPECGEPVPISTGPEEEPDGCPSCGSQDYTTQDDDMVSCDGCGNVYLHEVREHSSDGCPSCGSKDYTTQDGDMVSCDNCGNVYLHEVKLDGPDTSWKWKFWLGLIFILVGDFGFALVSYLHNAARWSPLGDMYLGYGWMDTMLGAIGITIFIVGLVLFAWSFKREREVDCPSCGVHIRESDLLPSEDEEEEEGEENGVFIEGVVGEIEDVAECPDCGSPVTIFDIECSECGAKFETDEYEEEIIEEEFVEEATFEEEGAGAEDIELAGELTEEDMVTQSLEYKEEPVDEELEAEPEIEPENIEVLEDMESQLTLNGLNGEIGLESTETDLDLGLDINGELDLESGPKVDLGLDNGSGLECPECGSMIDAGSKECPVCGSAISDGGVE